MNKTHFIIPAALGALAILWVATLFIGNDALALLVTLLIAGAYSIGIYELWQFRSATATLNKALDNIPAELNQLDDWLPRVHSSLQNSVRLRIESERIGLPAPVLTPYLVGLLVMLGLLGTFIGMVDTLAGAVSALQGSTELQAIREGLAKPINGLSLAFGTSVAGVAASAMLGLISTLSRRERMQATRELDNKISTELRQFSLTHNRQQTYNALQAQAQALPELVIQMQQMLENITQHGQTLSETLASNQADFQQSVQASFTELAESVDKTLGDSLSSSAQSTGEVVNALLSENLAAMAQESKNTQQHLSNVAEQEFGRLATRLEQTFGQQWAQSTSRMDQLSESVASHVAKLGSQLEEPLATLLETAAETPKAATEVIGQLRQEIESNVERDNALLIERQALMEQLGSSTGALEKVSADFSSQLSAELNKVSSASEHYAGSAAEMASLGEAFASAVQQYSESNTQLVEQLNRVEQSMEAAGKRSDQQMAYYVAQAREIIDQSLLSQTEMLNEMRQSNSEEEVAALN